MNRTASGVCAPSQISFATPLEPARELTRPQARPAGRGTPPPAAPASALLPPGSTITRPAPFRRASGSHSGSPRTTVAPGWTTASFSSAIASRVSPRTSVCSCATFVSTCDGRARAHSSRRADRPSPASTAADVDAGLGERGRAAAVTASNCVASEASAAGRTRVQRPLEVRLAPVDADPLGPAGHVGRECTRRRRAPSREQRLLDRARRRRLAVRADDVDRWVLQLRVAELAPAARASGRARSRPGATATEIPASQARREHRALAGSVRASRAPPARPRGAPSPTKPLVPEHPLGPLDLLLQPLALDLDVAVRPSRARAGRPPRRSAARRRRARRARRCAGRSLRPSARRSMSRSRLPSRAVGLGPRRDDQPRRAELRPDLLGDVRHHGMQERDQPLERCERRRARVGIPLVEPRLDRLRVPVAEVVEREVVEAFTACRELETREIVARPRARAASMRAEDPALLDSRGPRLGGERLRPARARAAPRSRACSRACAPPRSLPTEKRTSCVDDIFSRP